MYKLIGIANAADPPINQQCSEKLLILRIYEDTKLPLLFESLYTPVHRHDFVIYSTSNGYVTPDRELTDRQVILMLAVSQSNREPTGRQLTLMLAVSL